MSAEISDIARRLASMVRVGRVAEVNHAQVRVRVTFGPDGGNKTAWLPWMAGRAGATKEWNPPSVGEQVVVLSPSGNPAAGFILAGSINWNSNPAPASSGNITKTVFADGTTITQDATSKAYSVSVPAGGQISLACGSSSITIADGQITLNTPNLVLAANSISAASTSGGSASATFTGDINQTGNINQTGSITSTGDHVAGSISLKTHRHGGVQSGGSNTGTPV
jgi:phage baseplate assembly protein V